MDSVERDLREMFSRREADLPALPPAGLRSVLSRIRRRQMATVAGGVLGVAAALVVSIVAVRGEREPAELTPADRPRVASAARSGELIASGEGWNLLLRHHPRGHVAGAGVLCFTLVEPGIQDLSCVGADHFYLGLATLDPLPGEDALLYGTVSRRVERIRVRFEDSSIAEADISAPPESVEIKHNLFVLELQGPPGVAVATLLDHRGRRLGINEFRFPPRRGDRFLTLDRT